MEFYRRNPFFYTTLGLLLGLCVAGLWYLSKQGARLDELKRTYDQKSSQYARYVAARPSPTKTNLKALEDNYAELYASFRSTMSALDLGAYDRDAFFGSAPDSRAAWSYEINKYIAGARYQGLGNSIRLPQNASFGFSDPNYVPPEEESTRVHRQITIMGSLLQALFDSGIESFERIQRGVAPAPAKGKKGAAKAPVLTSEIDQFLVDPGMSSAVPGVVDAYTFRVAFRGQSIALRSFLNRLVNAPLPYAIRGIEVDLAGESGSKTELGVLSVNPFSGDKSTKLAGEASNVPIIAENASLFVVTIEFLDLVADIAPPETPKLEAGGSDA